MFSLVYRDGTWQLSRRSCLTGRSRSSPGVMTMHYGQMVFEGLKAYFAASTARSGCSGPSANAARLRRFVPAGCASPKSIEDLFVDGAGGAGP